MKSNLKSYIKGIAFLSVVIFLLLSACMKKGAFETIGTTTSIVAVISMIYAKWLWRYNPFDKTPKLQKHYVGVCVSGFDSSSRDITITVKQTLLSVTVNFESDESDSSTIFSDIFELHGKKYLSYLYINNPKAAIRERSPIHYGTCTLCLDNPTKLQGRYFTDRNTTGDIELFPSF